VVLAIAVFTLAAVSGLALFGGLVRSSGYIRQRDNAIRLNGALDDVLRSQSISQIFNWVGSGSSGATNSVPVYAYTYIASVTQTTPDGLPQPLASPDLSKGSSNICLVPSLRSGTDARLALELPAIQGGLYRVRLTVANINSILTLPSDYASYQEGSLAIYAEFYPVSGTGQLFAPGKTTPIHTCTISYITQ
jgi:hypothetical protein